MKKMHVKRGDTVKVIAGVKIKVKRARLSQLFRQTVIG